LGLKLLLEVLVSGFKTSVRGLVELVLAKSRCDLSELFCKLVLPAADRWLDKLSIKPGNTFD
jgi:hypothetical protein